MALGLYGKSWSEKKAILDTEEAIDNSRIMLKQISELQARVKKLEIQMLEVIENIEAEKCPPLEQ